MTHASPGDAVMVVGAGVGGLAAAIDLARSGVPVTVLERAASPGGKMRTLDVGGTPVDAGPTVLTFRPAFEQLFADAGANLDDHVTLTPATRLARHVWDGDRPFDLYANREQSVETVRRYFGPDQARRFARFQRDGERLYRTLERSFLTDSRPGVASLVARVALERPSGLTAMRPFASLWKVLSDYGLDPRLRQLYGRYATYCGASPFAAPSTLMMIAALEQRGVWIVEGGMSTLAAALAGLAERLGVTMRYNAGVERIEVEGGRASAVRLETGEVLPARAVLSNADPDAMREGLFGPEPARALPRPAGPRALSALVWTATGRAEGLAIDHHTVAFSSDYRAEFDAIFENARVPDDPTVYLCAQNRGAGPAPEGEERFLMLINAPADGDRRSYSLTETDTWLARTINRLERSGLRLTLNQVQTTAPDGFAARFPGSGGALYGRALHGWRAAFLRPGARTRLAGLYLAGGGAHPGPGVPTSLLSGRTAARSILADFASTPRSRPAGIAGSTPTRSARTGVSASS